MVVFGDPPGVSWGLLGATNSLQKQYRMHLLVFGGLLGVTFRLTRSKTGPVSLIPLCLPRLAGFVGGRRQAA